MPLKITLPLEDLLYFAEASWQFGSHLWVAERSSSSKIANVANMESLRMNGCQTSLIHIKSGTTYQCDFEAICLQWTCYMLFQ